MNQNEITSGRSKRSQTRITLGSVDLAGRRAPVVLGTGVREVSQSSWKTFASASSAAEQLGHRELGQRLAALASSAPSTPPSSVRNVLTVAITIRATKASPTKIE